ncbi:hypothetical protein RHMOL_Rhmol08G0176700 [Rhododendron molle]|uniref:Uncharacterized protein n=1 Tax=Rhododendron molle TaxID=49168 RepID=A0ACC0MQX5_RHOML|nr:hypothetical protein RHMOL_Rhmol08G0176700 [Rhododendron molle]
MGSVPTQETYYQGTRGFHTDLGNIPLRAPYRPPKCSTKGSRASLLHLMRHSIK